MNTRMEKVAEDVALTTLRIVDYAAQPTPQPEKLKEDFQARWPVPDSRLPMNDAMSAAAQAVSSYTGQDADSWKPTVSQTWQPAVEEVIEEYFRAARNSFEKGEPLEGVETLTDAVRATLGNIAAVRNWPHGTDDNLYRMVAALGSGHRWQRSERRPRSQHGTAKKPQVRYLRGKSGRGRGGRIPLRHDHHRTGQPAGRTVSLMNQEEHVSMARELMGRADEESGTPRPSVKRTGSPPRSAANSESPFRHRKRHRRPNHRRPAQLAPDCATRHRATVTRH